MIIKGEDINYVTSRLLQRKVNFKNPHGTHHRNRNKQEKYRFKIQSETGTNRTVPDRVRLTELQLQLAVLKANQEAQ